VNSLTLDIAGKGIKQTMEDNKRIQSWVVDEHRMDKTGMAIAIDGASPRKEREFLDLIKILIILSAPFAQN